MGLGLEIEELNNGRILVDRLMGEKEWMTGDTVLMMASAGWLLAYWEE